MLPISPSLMISEDTEEIYGKVGSSVNLSVDVSEKYLHCWKVSINIFEFKKKCQYNKCIIKTNKHVFEWVVRHIIYI